MVDRSVPDDELFARLRVMANELPANSGMRRLVLTLDDPANDEASKDRYVALVAGGVVEEGLKVALARHLGVDVTDRVFTGRGKLAGFAQRIEKAALLGIVSAEEEGELTRIRLIRNIFAHALAPISFTAPELAEVTRRFWHHPVSSWSGYFAPAFKPRARFTIVCGEFYSNLVRD